MPDDFITIRTSAVSLLSEVRLYADTWEDIIKKHPEFKLLELQPALIDTVSNPTHVHQSSTSPENTVVYISGNNTYQGNPLRVPVKIHSETSGRVKTAYFSGGTYSGTLLYREADDGE